MGNVFRPAAIVTALCLMLIGCQTTDQGSGDQSAKAAAGRLTQAEAISHVSGNTEAWSQGGGYYSPDGSLIAKWQGDDASGTWEVTEDGTLCLVLDLWGGGQECHYYVNDGGTITLVYKGTPRVAEVRSGNQLSTIE